MAHTIMGLAILMLALLLVGIAVVVTPVLRYLQINRPARIAFGALMISLGTYLAWISRLFFQNELGSANYTIELVFLRLTALVAASWFLGAAVGCSRRLARDDPKVSRFLVHEDRYEHPCPKQREDDT